MPTFCRHVRGPNGCPWCDSVHMAAGFLSSVLPGAWGASAGCCFLAYQMLRAKSAGDKVAALNQWGLGYLGGRLL